MKQFLEDNDVHLDAFEELNKKRSKTIILVKNLPADTDVQEIIQIFEKFGVLGRVLLPPSGVTALVEFTAPSEARKAFKRLAYTKFKHVPLYLEWAPENTFKTSAEVKKIDSEKEEAEEENSKETPPEFPTLKKEKKKSAKTRREEKLKEEQKLLEEQEVKDKQDTPEIDRMEVEEDDDSPEPDTTLFIKNLNFKSNEPAVLEHFKHLGPIHIVQVARKKDPENPRQQISLGYGFIQFKKSSSADKALKTMQFTEIEGKKIELKRSDRTLQVDQVKTTRKSAKKINQKDSTKIMIRNIPFQANIKEIREIFKVFGEIKAIRLPKKMVPGSESHRGFGFVDYFNKSEAKSAFDALHLSTHLYGRRLVLEWAEPDEDVEQIRKRTSEQFHGAGGSEPKRNKKSVFKSDHIKFVEEEDQDE